MSKTAADMIKPHTRLDAVDLLRGLVMVIMALDHVRDFFSKTALQFDPTDLTKTTSALFLTRWVTHFCAPVFVFLAGTGAYLSLARGKSKPELAKFLISRGLWLIVLELTIVRFGWTFNFDYHFVFVQVIWALGWSMIVLAALIFLPMRIIAAFGIVMVATHNLFDQISPESFGALAPLWRILHVSGPLPLIPNYNFFVMYPLIPWIGVMAAGYGFGVLITDDPAARRRTFIKLGSALIAAFIVLRAINIYGDPQPWSVQPNALFTIWSFINCQKYPPSLLFLLMTLGPSIFALAFFEQGGRWARPLIIFGRVPLFYYLIHLILIHALAGVFMIIKYHRTIIVNNLQPLPDYGYSLPVVYGVWLLTIVLLFPLCYWFAGLKRRRRDAWLSYL